MNAIKFAIGLIWWFAVMCTIPLVPATIAPWQAAVIVVAIAHGGAFVLLFTYIWVKKL